jgi:aminotransferase
VNYEKILSGKVQALEFSGIRKFFDIAATMKNVISLSVGEPDFLTPYAIRRKAVETLQAGKTRYTSNAGMDELRDGLSVYLKRLIGVEYSPKDEILVTVGGSEAIDAAFRALIDTGDEVLVPEPSFVCYKPLADLCGGKAIPIETRIEDNFKLTPDALRAAITPRTKILVLPYPNNPTGGVMRRHELESIADVLRGTNIIVVSDEIYGELTYGGEPHVSIASLPDMRERTVVINGFSKAFAMTGWRLGFAAAPPEITRQMLKIHQYAIMCAPTVSQAAAVTALNECIPDVAKMVGEYDLRRKFCVKAFNKLGLPTFTPEGAFYIFPSIKSTGLSSQEFCKRLITDKQVAVVPGDAFGVCGEGFIRVSYAYSLTHLEKAASLIHEFLSEI